MKCVTVNIIWKILHSRWTVVLQLEWSALQWTLSGRYFTADGQWYCSLNEVCYSEHYLEDTSQQVDSGIAAWMNCVTMNLSSNSQFLRNKVPCTTVYFLSKPLIIIRSKYNLNSLPTTSNISRSCPTYHNSLPKHTLPLWTPLLHSKQQYHCLSFTNHSILTNYALSYTNPTLLLR